MANADIAFGLKPVNYLSGSPYNGAARMYYVPAADGTALYIGSPVKLGGTADSDGVASVTIATAGDAILGPVIAVLSVTQESTIYREASTERYVFIADDPQLLFEIQEDSTGGDLAATSVGLNASWSGSGGVTATGISSVELDSSTANTTNTLDFSIVGLARRPDNEIGTNAVWLVRLNDHQRINQATGL